MQQQVTTKSWIIANFEISAFAGISTGYFATPLRTHRKAKM